MKDKLRIGMQLLADLENVRVELVPCFPPHYNILQFFITQYAVIANNNVSAGAGPEAQMQPYYDDPTLEPGEILVLVEWLDSFLEEVRGWAASPSPCSWRPRSGSCRSSSRPARWAEGVSLRRSRAWRFGSSAFWSGATSRWSRKRAIWSRLSQKTCSV